MCGNITSGAVKDCGFCSKCCDCDYSGHPEDVVDPDDGGWNYGFKYYDENPDDVVDVQ